MGRIAISISVLNKDEFDAYILFTAKRPMCQIWLYFLSKPA